MGRSLTPTTDALPLAGDHADAFTSAYYINVTNYTHGLVHNGSIIYRRTELTLSLDRSAEPIEDLFVGMYLTIGNESRTIVKYSVLREVPRVGGRV